MVRKLGESDRPPSPAHLAGPDPGAPFRPVPVRTWPSTVYDDRTTFLPGPGPGRGRGPHRPGFCRRAGPLFRLRRSRLFPFGMGQDRHSGTFLTTKCNSRAPPAPLPQSGPSPAPTEGLPELRSAPGTALKQDRNGRIAEGKTARPNGGNAIPPGPGADRRTCAGIPACAGRSPSYVERGPITRMQWATGRSGPGEESTSTRSPDSRRRSLTRCPFIRMEQSEGTSRTTTVPSTSTPTSRARRSTWRTIPSTLPRPPRDFTDIIFPSSLFHLTELARSVP
jgi:hypothetical protein